MSGTFKRDLLTGLVMLFSLAGLVLTLWLFGDIRNVWERYYSFTLRLDVAGGLSSTSPVALNGLKIGSVIKAVVRDDPSEGVDFTIRVKQDVKVPDDFTVYIDRSFVGETTLSLELPAAARQAADRSFVVADAVYERKAKTLMSLVAEQIKEPLDRVGDMAEDVRRLADVYEKVGKNAATLLEPRTPAEVNAGAAPNIASTIARLDSALVGVDHWLGDEDTRSDFAAMMKRGATATEKLDHTLDAYRKLADDASAAITQLSKNVGSTSEEASTTLRRMGDAADQVRQFTSAINSGEGTLGQLARNPDLYNNANDAASRLEKAIAEFQLLLEKYRTEGLKLQF